MKPVSTRKSLFIFAMCAVPMLVGAWYSMPYTLNKWEIHDPTFVQKWGGLVGALISIGLLMISVNELYKRGAFNKKG